MKRTQRYFANTPHRAASPAPAVKRVESRTRRLRAFLTRHTESVLVLAVCLVPFLAFLYTLSTR